MGWGRQNQPPVALADGSLAGLTAEVRALRLSLEEAAKSQTQVQGVGVYLSVEKDRLLQMTARLDSAQKATMAAAEQARLKAEELRQLEAFAANPGFADRREEFTAGALRMKLDVDRLKQNESDVRNREVLAEQEVQSEQMRWNELVSRLEQLIRR